MYRSDGKPKYAMSAEEKELSRLRRKTYGVNITEAGINAFLDALERIPYDDEK